MPLVRPPSTVEPMLISDLLSITADAHCRTKALVADLSDEMLIGPCRRNFLPPLWVLGHIAWLYDHYLLDRLGMQPVGLSDVGALFNDQIALNSNLWNLPLPDIDTTMTYFNRVADSVPFALGDLEKASPEASFACRFCVQREDMLGEMLITQRQVNGFPAPSFVGDMVVASGKSQAGDVYIPGGIHSLGASPEDGFILDNEKWGHGYEVAPFHISRLAVTNEEFLIFLEDGGYERSDLWSKAGWGWRSYTKARNPVYWRENSNGWNARLFDKWELLKKSDPIIHVNWFEADAWCRWAGRRLPWEGEWEIAASLVPRFENKLSGPKHRYPWNKNTINVTFANLDGNFGGPCDVTSFPSGDSGYGARQMIGNVWEWTQSALSEYPGFAPDMMEKFSRSHMDGRHPVLRGGSWATRGRAVWNTLRNFEAMDRSDRFSGFRTCAV